MNLCYVYYIYKLIILYVKRYHLIKNNILTKYIVKQINDFSDLDQ